MAIAEWPATLPEEPLVRGYEETRPDMAVRTQADKGPPKVRRNTSKALRPMSVSFLLTATQAAALETFVSDTLGEGTYRFSWTHPRTGSAVEMLFLPVAEKRLYTLTPVGAAHWQATCKLGVLP